MSNRCRTLVAAALAVACLSLPCRAGPAAVAGRIVARVELAQGPATTPAPSSEPPKPESDQAPGGTAPPATGTPASTPSAPDNATPTPSAIAALPHELSPWTMFLNADIVVKGVMVGLAFASVVTWTVWFARGLSLGLGTIRMRQAVAGLAAAENLAALDGAARWRRRGPAATLLDTARGEAERSAALPADGIKERTAIALARIEARAARAMTRGTGLIATIGATAPFVGLFGTVWGIMNSFVGISKAHTSNLAVVAPGIAEALLATAIGLVAAIPAVIIYNVFSRALGGYRALLADAAAEVMRHLSRDLDRRDLGVRDDDLYVPAE